MRREMLFSNRCTTPVGEVLLLVDEGGVLLRLSFLERGLEDEVAARLISQETEYSSRIMADAKRVAPVSAALLALLAGERRELEVPFEPRGTAFQHLVWKALQRIPYGETRTYAEIAAEIESPDAVRAVGRASATNPIAIAIPCHRVIGADGSLTGYFGGVSVKRALLELEQRGELPPPEAPDEPPPKKLGDGLRITGRRR